MAILQYQREKRKEKAGTPLSAKNEQKDRGSRAF
jgi:hypothetical protein